MSDEMKKAAEWHRKQAAALRTSAKDKRDFAAGYYKRQADLQRHLRECDRQDAIAAHYEAAAQTLEALAVPGVAEVLAYCAGADRGDDSDDVRAALATLAKIGGAK